MKAGKLNTEFVNFMGFDWNLVDQQRLREIEDEFEYEMSATDRDEDEDEEDDSLFDSYYDDEDEGSSF
jgi:hypothetical protein